MRFILLEDANRMSRGQDPISSPFEQWDPSWIKDLNDPNMVRAFLQQSKNDPLTYWVIRTAAYLNGKTDTTKNKLLFTLLYSKDFSTNQSVLNKFPLVYKLYTNGDITLEDRGIGHKGQNDYNWFYDLDLFDRSNSEFVYTLRVLDIFGDSKRLKNYFTSEDIKNQNISRNAFYDEDGNLKSAKEIYEIIDGWEKGTSSDEDKEDDELIKDIRKIIDSIQRLKPLDKPQWSQARNIVDRYWEWYTDGDANHQIENITMDDLDELHDILYKDAKPVQFTRQ